MSFELAPSDRQAYTGTMAVVANRQTLVPFKNGDGFVFSIRAVDLSTAEAYAAAMEKASALKTPKAREKAEKAASDLRAFYTVKFWLRGFDEASAQKQCSALHSGREFSLTDESVKDERREIDGVERVFPTVNVNLGKPTLTAPVAPADPF